MTECKLSNIMHVRDPYNVGCLLCVVGVSVLLYAFVEARTC